ncbi:MAG: 16S rRNA (guanine(966)-N(2))-methyltransferase RsmD [Elusimicrobia bacterium RIFOXYA2_FULL_39_19]|nr:MAG: 16S rRNA (guanine(966)-N(2))-methyltransferase RsmD [Elusimicrobia bacterium RIFOXYA2_FULL_39_19]
MTIIGGELSGQLLLPVDKNHPLRPILARIKKSIFDIIRLKLDGAVFLDLFAGTGSVGIEAISRGASQVVFVDTALLAVKMVEKNLQKLKIMHKAKICQRDVLFGLGWLKNITRENYFDIVFMGPPYKLYCVNKLLTHLKEANVLKADGLIVAQHHQTEKVETTDFRIVRTEKYGDTIVTFLKNV